MYNKLMRNLNIRQKLIVIYVHITIWTIPYIIGAVVLINILGNDNGTWDPAYVLKVYIPITVVYSAIYVGFTIWMGRSLTKQIVYPLREAISNVEKVGKGDLNVTFEHDGKDEVSQVIGTLQEMADSIKMETEVLERLAEGDYTEHLSLRGEHDMIYMSLMNLQKMNSKFISEIKDAAIQISTGATQIAGGAQNLASGSNEQASTIEEFSASITDIKLKADENAQTAQGTLNDIEENSRLMQGNIEEIRKVNIFIDELAKDSKQIAKVIKVIDDIAFQTNILALNAAVEAARAGQHGKGFAVVADEVRELASKSAQAAKETSDLIKKSLDSVDEGSRLVEKTNAGIKQMGEISEKNQSSMTKMSQASIEQGESISEIDKGISQISNVVQANSSMAEESAAAAQEMSAQADYLNKMISRFKTKDEKDGSPYQKTLDTSVSSHDDDHGTAENEKIDLNDFFPEPEPQIHKEEDQPHGVQFVNAAGPELEDFSKIEVPDKYSDS